MNDGLANGEDDSARTIGPCSDTLSWDGTLCNSCRDLLDLVLDRVERSSSTAEVAAKHNSIWLVQDLPYHGRFRIKRCAALGCKLCQAYMDDEEHEAPFADGNLCTANVSLVGSYARLKIYTKASKARLSVSLRFLGHRSRPWRSIDLGDHTGSEGTLEMVRQWLKGCEDHVECNTWRNAAKRCLPTRLIELSGSHEQPDCRLVHTAGLSVQTEYASLSYRWGSHLPLRCKKDNINDLSQHIQWHLLPKTFQEAASVAISIGLRYVWIDALCIIQDDPDDWASESGTMATVYSNTSLNLSADASADATEGLFRQRSDFADFTVVDSARIPVAACYRYAAVKDRIWDGYRSSQLSNRGWVIQERILAPRTLYFGLDMVHLVCMEAGAVDCFGASGPEKHALLQTQPHDRWHDIVQRYSRTITTYDSDRPIAIAGLAEKMCELFGYESSDYLCGLWKPLFIHSLVWQAYDTTCEIDTGDGTPSWSWLLWRGWVFVEAGPDKSHAVAELLAGSSVPIRSPFGPVMSAYSRVKGPLCEVHFQAMSDKAGHFSMSIAGMVIPPGRQENGTESRFHFDCPLEQDIAEVASPVYLLLCTKTKGAEEDAQKTWRSGHWNEFWSACKTFTHLMLRPAGDPGRFRRIGVAQLSLGATDIAARTKSGYVLDHHFRSSHIPPDLYHEKDEHCMYTITLV